MIDSIGSAASTASAAESAATSSPSRYVVPDPLHEHQADDDRGDDDGQPDARAGGTGRRRHGRQSLAERAR